MSNLDTYRTPAHRTDYSPLDDPPEARINPVSTWFHVMRVWSWLIERSDSIFIALWLLSLISVLMFILDFFGGSP